ARAVQPHNGARDGKRGAEQHENQRQDFGGPAEDGPGMHGLEEPADALAHRLFGVGLLAQHLAGVLVEVGIVGGALGEGAGGQRTDLDTAGGLFGQLHGVAGGAGI
nr:hypothetical protein [Tanacetum cinerariifolium]